MKKTVVITGSTRGIGRGMAHEFLLRGHQVVISGRTQAGVDTALAALSQTHDTENIFGQPCDVSDYKQVQNLWDATVQHFGQVDIWISNAGISHKFVPFHQIAPEEVQANVNVNMLGNMYNAHVAVNGMLSQGHGQYYIMEGAGSTGNARMGMTAYGATKRGINYLFDALVMEHKNDPIQIGALSPGMVLTDMLGKERMTSEEEWERVKRIFNILADKVETVTPWLVERMLANTKHGAKIRWLTGGKVMWRFATASFNKRTITDIYDEA